MKVLVALLGIAILALANMGLMEALELLDNPFEPYSWGLNIGFSLFLLFCVARLFDEAIEKGKQDALVEHSLGETKQDIEGDDDDDLDDDTSTDFPMFTDEATPREYKFGTIDLVFRGATGAEAAIMAIQFISNDIFEEAKPAHRGPSSFGRPLNEAVVRVIYRRLNDLGSSRQRYLGAARDHRGSLRGDEAQVARRPGLENHRQQPYHLASIQQIYV